MIAGLFRDFAYQITYIFNYVLSYYCYAIIVCIFRKPERTIHIAPCGSASLVKSSQKTQSIPKQLHHSIQHVRTSLNNLNQEMDLYINSQKDLKIGSEDMCDASGDEEGILAIRTCKSREDKLPPIDTLSNVHIVDIFDPKTPQKLYYVNIFNSDHDSCDSSSNSSSEGYLPSKQSVSKKALALTHLVDHQYTKSENTTINPSVTMRSRSCSPSSVKVAGQQQRPLKDFSVKVTKLPQSLIASRNTNIVDSMHSSDETNESNVSNNLISIKDAERAEISIFASNALNIEQGSKPTATNELLWEGNIEIDAFSYTEDTSSITQNVQEETDDLSGHSLSPMDCDNHMQNVTEVGYHGNLKKQPLPEVQKDSGANINIAISLPISRHEDDDPYKESITDKENDVNKIDNNTALSGSDAECKVDSKLENSKTTSHKHIVKKASKQVKSEKYVLSSCSENETNVDSEKLERKRKQERKKITSSKGENNVQTTLLHKGIKAEKTDALNSSQSNKHTVTSSLEQDTETSTVLHFSEPSHDPTYSDKTDCLESCAKQNDAGKPLLVKRKLNMTEETIIEGMDAKGDMPKYKLRSKGKKAKCCLCIGNWKLNLS